MLLRETLYGADTFSAFQKKLGISRNILNQRLKFMMEEGLFIRELYSEKPKRHRYRLTEKGRSALAILAAMSGWSNEWLFPEDERPILMVDKRTGATIEPLVIDAKTGQAIDFKSLELQPGPGFPEDARSWRFGELNAG